MSRLGTTLEDALREMVSDAIDNYDFSYAINDVLKDTDGVDDRIDEKISSALNDENFDGKIEDALDNYNAYEACETEFKELVNQEVSALEKDMHLIIADEVQKMKEQLKEEMKSELDRMVRESMARVISGLLVPLALPVKRETTTHGFTIFPLPE